MLTCGGLHLAFRLRTIPKRQPHLLMTTTHLKHGLNIVVFVFEQLAPGGQIAVGEYAAGL